MKVNCYCFLCACHHQHIGIFSTVISGGAFINCNKIDGDLVIPASVEKIYTQAFDTCQNLDSLSFAPGSKLQLIDLRAFYNCKQLIGTLTIPDEVSIGFYAFTYCSKLSAVRFLGNTLSPMGTDAFRDCYALATVYVPSTWSSSFVTLPGKGTFSTTTGNLVREIAFSDLTANGESDTTTTTELTLTFHRAFTSLTADDIILTGATKGVLSSTETPGEYKLTITNITVTDSTNITVEIVKTGFAFTPPTKQWRCMWFYQ